jgi:predicted alpha/beta superfamily hydrolase
MGKANKLLLIAVIFFISCHSKIKERKDEVYSRHLQKHVSITVISTPVPKNKSDFNLLLLNDGQELEKLRVKKIVDSLYEKKLLQPLIIIGINAFDRLQEYGVSGKPDYQGNGASAEKYVNFVIGELLPFVKKKSGVRKFNSVAIVGCSLGGLSAFDIAWDNADKIDKVGVFSGSFGYSNKAKTDSSYLNDKDRILINKIISSRKRPHLKYWFYASGNETANTDKIMENTEDLVGLIKKKNVANAGDINFVKDKNGNQGYDSWSHFFPKFLIWADGK